MSTLQWTSGVVAGLAIEKWFVFWGWPDTSATMAVIATILAVVGLIVVLATEEATKP